MLSEFVAFEVVLDEVGEVMLEVVLTMLEIDELLVDELV